MKAFFSRLCLGLLLSLALAGTSPAETLSAPAVAATAPASLLDLQLVLQPARTAGTSIPGTNASNETAMALRIVLGLTLITLLPALLVCLTAFLRIIIVLSMLRHALGMPETPPNTVLIGLALFMTLFTMSPVLEQINQQAFQPFMQNRLALDTAASTAAQPLRAFMLRQTRPQDLVLMTELAKVAPPAKPQDIGSLQLIPAFMLSELRAAFQIGFLVFLPFLLIDLIVSSILMALGMMMMPPMTIALPIKILMFILIDGWGLLLRGLVGSFH